MTHPARSCFRASGIFALLGLLTACQPMGTNGAEDRDTAPPLADFETQHAGDTVRSVHPVPRGALLFLEPRGGGLVEHDVRRTLLWVDERGTVRSRIRAPEDELFLDVVTHPSGESTLFLAAGELCHFRRYSPDGTLLGSATLEAPDLATDPTDVSADPVIPWNVGKCQPLEIKETARLAADAESFFLVNRGGSHGIVLFRFEYASGVFTRTLRVPLLARHAAPLPTGIGASHRVLRSTHWSFVPRVVVDDAGSARVLLIFGGGVAHDIYNAFASTPVADDARGVIITVTPQGSIANRRELPRALIAPQTVTEYEGIRWLRGGVMLTGRVAPAPPPETGHGWDGFVVHLNDAEPTPGLVARVDLPASAVFSDIAAHGPSAWFVAGRSGYWQNPRGASISEEANRELLVLDATGAITWQAKLSQGARHNAALSLAESRETPGVYLVGGLSNGPGSHSADSDRSMLEADGWVMRTTMAQH